MFISEVVKGGAAELDGRLMQGDQILSVDSEDTRQTSQEAVAAMLKVYLIHAHTHSLTLLTCGVCVSSSVLGDPSSWSWADLKPRPGCRLKEVR